MSDDKKTAESPGMWLSELEAHLWAMHPRHLESLCALAAAGRLEAHLKVDAEQMEAARRRGRPKAISGGVVTVPLKGVLAPVGGLLAMLFDIPNPLDVFRASLREALADPEVGAIVIDIDSPGGVVDGIPEAAAELRALRGTKPIIAHANSMAASAAYWLAAQADEVVMTPSGAVGSIGVYATHRDLSGAMEMMGVKNTLISAGKYKTEGNPYEPLSDEAKAHIQQDVDHFYGLFTADVAKGRNVTPKAVREGYGEGRVLNAQAALEAKLVDRVEPISETVARVGSRSRGPLLPRAAADDPVNKLEAEADDAGAAEEVRAEAEAGASDDVERTPLSADDREALLQLASDLDLDMDHVVDVAR